MTEIPEHLLKRSKERRAALGLGGGDDAAPAASSPTPTASSTASAPAATTPAVPATPPPAPVVKPPPPIPPYVAAAEARPKMPRWVAPVAAVGLPLWALVYAGSLSPIDTVTDPVLAEGQELYESNCAACHGGEGGGGIGRVLSGGEVLLTFPDPAGHVEWVVEGSDLVGEGNPYGDPNRPGGQRISQSDGFGAMPGFADTFSEEQILAIVRYEREVLSGEVAEPAVGDAAGEDEGGAGEGANEGAGGDGVDNSGNEGGAGQGSGSEGSSEEDTDTSTTEGG